MNTKIKSIVTMVLALSASFLIADELLYNSAFTAVEPSEKVQSIFEKNLIKFSGKTFPRFWTLSSKETESENKVEFDGKFTFKNADQMILAIRNYRIASDNLQPGENYRAELHCAGEGSVTFGFYRYGDKHKFIGNTVIETITLQPQDKLIVFTFPQTVIPEETKAVAPYFLLKGDMSVTGASIKLTTEIVPKNLVNLIEFDKLDPLEQQNVVLKSDDLDLLSHAAKNKNRDVRNRACYMLGNLGEKAYPAYKILVENMNYPFEPVRVQSAVALTKLGPKAYGAIKKILLDVNKNNRLTLATAVRGMPNGVPEELQKYVDWANPPVMQTGDSLLPDSSFESSTNEQLIGWELELRDGATGHWEIDSTRARNGLKSLKITKTNGLGYIILRSTLPVIVPPGKATWTFRTFFQCFDAGYNTLLLPRLETASGSLRWDDTSLNGGAGWQSQSLLRNTPNHFWDRRMIMLRQTSKEQQFRPALVLYGNPATVWVDDVDFPAPPWKAFAAGPVYPQPAYNLEEALEITKKRPVSSLEVKSINGKSALLVDGEKKAPVLYLVPRGASGDFKFITKDAGIELPVVRVNLRAGGNYPPFTDAFKSGAKSDFNSFFDTIENAIRMAPESYIIVGLSVGWSDNYVDKNPSEAWLNEKGQKGWGTLGNMRGFADALPKNSSATNPNIWWPSQYSEKAFSDAGDTIKKFLVELKKKPYANVISGVFVSGGHDGQFMIHHRDYSQPALKLWRNFLQERYGSDEALAKSWNQPTAKIKNAEILPKRPKESDDQMFYSPAKNRDYADFNEFEERQIWKNSERFAKIFKEVFGQDKLALTWCMGGGWRKNFEYFFNSKYLDAFVAQPSYEYRILGSSGGSNMVAESCSYHGKLAISELDTRNWMRGVYNELMTIRIGTPTSAEHFANLVMKDAGRMISRYQGYWIYDIGANAYRHPEALKIIKTTKDAASWVFQNAEKDHFVPDVAVVFHQPSIYWESPWGSGNANLVSRLVDYQLYAMRIAGVPFSSYYLRDIIANPKFQEHKVYIFMNAFFLNDAERQFIKERLQRDGKTLVWNYAPGFLNTNGLSAENVSSITGMNVKTSDELKTHLTIPVDKDILSKNLPQNMGVADSFHRRFSLTNSNYWKMATRRFWVDDSDAITIGKYHDDGRTAVAVKRFPSWISIYSAQVGGIDAELLRNIAKEAGAYTLTRPGLIIDMNGNFISIHAFAGGKYKLKLPRRADVYDVMSQKNIATNTDELELDIVAQSSKWLLLK